MKFRNLIYFLLTAMVAAIVQSCIYDRIDYSMETYEEGLAANVELNISVPSMDIATRSDMPNDADFDVKSLWVGIFSATDGKCKYAELHTELPSNEHNFISLRIKTTSGPSFIVAVGNPEDNYGYKYGPTTNDNNVIREDLTTILPSSKDGVTGAERANNEMNFDWTAYQNIAVRQLDLNDVNTPIGNLVMSGIYYESTDDPETAAGWEEANQKPVDINVSKAGGTVTLPGAVHLRRLISQVKFHLEAVPYTGDNQYKKGHEILEIIPQSFQVKNVPYTSWLHERKTNTEVGGDNKEANSGDNIYIDNKNKENPLGYEESEDGMMLKANYRSSVWFNGNQYLRPSADGKSFDFDFWMMENKRWASYDLYKNLGEKENAYDRREKEVKDSQIIKIPKEGTEGGYEEIPYDENLGIYLALCSSKPYNPSEPPTVKDVPETMNNCASFVEIRCRIIYTEQGLTDLRNEDDYKEVQYRSADAVYTIHLGGIDQNWNDFTHRRNHKYTYNVKIMDVDRIIVEARYDDEPRPGIEGVVTDVVNPPFEVDCHYSVFNIQLSNLERTGGGIIQEEGDDANTGDGTSGDHEINGGKYERGVFPFRIRYFDKDNFARYIDQSNIDEYMDIHNPDKNPLHWQWVEFRPTTGKDVIADYKPYEGEGSDGQTFRINEVANITKFRHPEDHSTSKDDPDKPDEDDTTLRWYTVFVNEYVYENSIDEGANNFMNYVNLEPRMCWFNTLFRSSIDDESNYIRSKYVVRQQSIQTFYFIPTGSRDQDINAIGMEHINETFGFNLRWDNVTTMYDDYIDNDSHTIKNNNGRHNTLLYLHAQTPLTDGTGFSNGGRDKEYKWRSYLDPNRLQFITSINTGSNQYGASYQLKEPPYMQDNNPKREPYYVPAIYTYTNGNSLGISDINTTYYLRIMDACMNRNRDNNGNGVIDIDEVRWYVPASSEIVDLVLGSYSMTTKLMDYENVNNKSLQSPLNSATEQAHQGNTRFHYATSNQRTLWAEEGTTINPEVDQLTGDPGWNLPPQNVRCVRALGTNLATDENRDLTPAFTTNAVYTEDDRGNRTYSVYPTEIYPTYFEQKNQRSYTSDVIEPHQESTGGLNRLCYYGFEFSKDLLNFSERELIGEDVVLIYNEYRDYPAGWYEPDLETWQPSEFDGGVYFSELRTGGLSFDGGNYLVDPTSYSASNPNNGAQQVWASEDGGFFWAGGVYYPGGDYPPLVETYSSTQFNGDKYDGSRVHYNSNNGGTYDGWYVPDVDHPSAEGSHNFWAGFFLDRVKCPAGGWYLPDLFKPVVNADGSINYWPDYISRTIVWFNGHTANGDVIRKAGYYSPDPTTGPENAPFKNSGYWKFARVGVGEPIEIKVPVYGDKVVYKQWSDPSGRSLPLFVLPYDQGQPGKFNKNQFVADHGSTLELGNSVCKQLDQETGRRGWRLPTMKEAALIKIAMDNAGVYKENGLTYEKYYHVQSGYNVGNFLACTFREYGVVNETTTDPTGYYTGIYYPESSDEAQTNDWYDKVGGKLMGRIACITTPYNRHYYIRCVRDLRSAGD